MGWPEVLGTTTVLVSVVKFQSPQAQKTSFYCTVQSPRNLHEDNTMRLHFNKKHIKFGFKFSSFSKFAELRRHLIFNTIIEENYRTNK